MSKTLNLSKDPYGLSSGLILSGSAVSSSLESYVFYPLTNCTNVTIRFSNVTNSPLVLNTAFAGVPIYGNITSVTSSGVAILYQPSIFTQI